MIKHLVMFYFTDKVTDENRDESKRLIADSVKKIKDADIKGVSFCFPFLKPNSYCGLSSKL